MASEAKITEAFNALDPTGTGFLNWNDFKDAARSLGTPFTDAQFETVKKSVGDKVNLASFKMVYLQLSASNPASDVEADLKAAFGAMDSKKEGKVSKKMVKHYLTNVGEKLSEQEADEILKGAPDQVDFASFKKAILGA